MSIFPRWVLVTAALLLAGMLVWYFAHIIICFLLAGILSLMLRPISEKIRKIRIGSIQVPSALAAILTIVFIIALFIAGFSLMAPLMIQQAKIISSIDLNMVMNHLREPLLWLERQLRNLNMLDDSEQSLKVYIQHHITDLVRMTDISQMFQSVFTNTGNIFLITFSTIFMLFFFLKEEKLFFKIIMLFMPDDKAGKLQHTLDNIRTILFRYVSGVILQIIIIIVFVVLAFYFLNIKNALLIGVLAGLLNIIPYLGPLIGLVFGLVLSSVAHLTDHGFFGIEFLMIKVIAVFMVVQLLDNYVFQPYIFSRSTRLHPLEIFVVIMAAATISGILGMIVAIPVYTILRIVMFEYFSETNLVQRIKNMR
jgi:predicted PurR-regulated permease PerM